MASKQQSKLQQYFQSFRVPIDNTVIGVETVQTRQDSDQHCNGMKRCAVGETKENKPPGSSDSMGAKQLSAGRSGRCQSAPRSSKQMFLDLGQKDFSSSKCSVCGMVYAKGHEEDEKLHRGFHQSAVQGLKFQGWGQERVVLSDPFSGRLLMVIPSDPSAHVKRAQEVCSFVEKAHGITSGWLMSSPQCKVFLFVSLQKRVVGLAVVEPIKQAYRVAAAAASGPVDQEADSSQLTQQQQQPVSLQAPPQQQPQPQPLLWPGLHRSSSRKPGGSGSGGGGGSGASVLFSAGAGAAGISSAAGGSTVKADSCPASLLAAAEQMQVANSTVAALSAQQQQQQQQQQQSGVSAASICNNAEGMQGHPTQSAQQDRLSTQQQQQDMPPPPPRVLAAAALSGAFSGPSSRSTLPDGSSSSASGRAAAAAVHEAGSGLASRSAVVGAGSSCSNGAGYSCRSAAEAGAGSGRSAVAAVAAAVTGPISNGGRSGHSRGIRAASASGASGGTTTSSSCIIADKRKAVRAMLGVRMVWVSAEQRRKGMATKLLDAARCNMVPGYVVPRNQMAHAQPTEDGSQLAASFTGTQQYLVYAIE